MRFWKTGLVALMGLAIASPAFGQLIPGWSPSGPYGFGRFGYSGRHFSIGGYIPGGYSPVYYGPYGYSHRWSSTTIIVAPPAISVRPSSPPVELPKFPQIPPLEEREDVIAIKPRAGGVKNLPPIRQAPGQVAKAKAPPDWLAPAPAADKAAEADRRIKLGKDAFAAGRPGEALDQFQQATLADPNQADGFFLLAQAQFALAKYREATVSILAGLKLKPDWPNARFHPRELYGAQAADYADDLDRLRLAVERNPGEPSLQFLYAYQLWFIDRRKEARVSFERAAKIAADPAPIRRFLDVPE